MKKSKKKTIIRNCIFIVILIIIPSIWLANYVISNTDHYDVSPLNDADYEVNIGEVVFSDPYYYYSGSGPSDLTAPARAIDNSSAVFFIGHNDNSFSNYSYIEKSNKDLANQSIDGTLDRGIDVFYRDLTPFLNTDYNEMGDESEYYLAGGFSPGTGNIFPKQIYGGINAPWDGDLSGINETFGVNIYRYFHEHALVLECNDLTLEKICVSSELLNPIDYVALSTPVKSEQSFIWIATANVTSKSAIGDMNEFGIFANAGETATIKIYARGTNLGIYDMKFERMW